MLGQIQSQKIEIDEAEKRIKKREEKLNELTEQYEGLKAHINSEKEILMKPNKRRKASLIRPINLWRIPLEISKRNRPIKR